MLKVQLTFLIAHRMWMLKMNKKVYRYKGYVDNANIAIDPSKKNGFYRYLLSIPLKNSGCKSVLVILKNPSKADKEQSDHTINNVLKFCRKDYKKVYIVNLFPCYSTNPKGVKKFISSAHFAPQMKNNINTLKAVLAEVDEVIFAWGRNSIGNKKEYDKAIKNVLDEIRCSNKKTFAVRKKGKLLKRTYPWHAQVWAVNSDLETYEWKI